MRAGASNWGPRTGASNWGLELGPRTGASSWSLELGPRAGASSWDLELGRSVELEVDSVLPQPAELQSKAHAATLLAVTRGPDAFDCQRCGACWCNPASNRAESFSDWVEVESRAPLLRRKQLVGKLVKTGVDGRPHLRLDDDHRCVALEGRIGHFVRCTIYRMRPKACRRVEAGSEQCLVARAEHGLTR